MKKKWYKYIYLEFYLRIPLLTVQTRLFTDAVGRRSYDICRLKIQLWKWKYEFDLYKREV